jgi:hypothetical protein
VDALEAVQILGALVTVACIAPMMLWKIRNRDGDLRYLYLSEDGYVAQALNRAKGASWVATFVLLCGLAQAAKDLDGVPSEIFIQIAIAVMLAVFSIVFLVMDPSDRELESDRA